MDPVQVFGSLAAIIVTALIAWRMFPARTPLDDGIVKRNLARYAPDAHIAAIYLSRDKKAAVASLTSPASSIGLAVRMGDRVVCRILQATDIKSVQVSGETLFLTFDDFTQPNIKLEFSPAALTEVLPLFDALTTVNGELTHAA
ncbi:hypothetical protein [Kordiimonas sp.]|uniref:hypothetical protein n=1 Tax=Kordiimonas sp. TaxID=1970157 RepID=UPI003A932089